MPATRGGGATNYQTLLMTQQEGREETSHWMSASRGVSPGSTSILGPWSHHPAWTHAVTTNMAIIPAMLTVHSVCHGSYSLCSPSASPTVPTTLAVPSTVSVHTLPSLPITTKPPTLNPVFPIPAASTTSYSNLTCPTLQHTQHTYRAKSDPACLPYQSCCAHLAHSYYCASSLVHLHRKHPCWFCRQRACICQAIEQERLEGLPLREGAERPGGGKGGR